MNVAIDRIDVALEGVSDRDARLLSEELTATLEPLIVAGAHERRASADGPLAPGLRGRALVDAVAARVADAIGEALREAARRQDDEADAQKTAGATTWP